MSRRARVVGIVLVVLLAGCTSSSQRSLPTVTPPTAASVAVATVVPTAPPTAVPPAPTPTTAPPPPTVQAAQPPLYVTNTGSDGLTLRRAPSTAGERLAVLPDGAALTPTGQQQQADGRTWRQVKDAQGREGWVAADFLSANAPSPATPTSAVVAAPTVTAAAVADSTATPFTTRVATPVPRTTPTTAPAIVAPPAPKPQAPAAAVTATRPPAVVAPTMAPIQPATAPAAPKPPAVACCARCSRGKACGNSCIAAHLNCHQPPGCACDAVDPPVWPDSAMSEQEFLAEAIVIAALNEEPTPCDVFALVQGVE